MEEVESMAELNMALMNNRKLKKALEDQESEHHNATEFLQSKIEEGRQTVSTLQAKLKSNERQYATSVEKLAGAARSLATQVSELKEQLSEARRQLSCGSEAQQESERQRIMGDSLRQQNEALRQRNQELQRCIELHDARYRVLSKVMPSLVYKKRRRRVGPTKAEAAGITAAMRREMSANAAFGNDEQDSDEEDANALFVEEDDPASVRLAEPDLLMLLVEVLAQQQEERECLECLCRLTEDSIRSSRKFCSARAHLVLIESFRRNRASASIQAMCVKLFSRVLDIVPSAAEELRSIGLVGMLVDAALTRKWEENTLHYHAMRTLNIVLPSFVQLSEDESDPLMPRDFKYDESVLALLRCIVWTCHDCPDIERAKQPGLVQEVGNLCLFHNSSATTTSTSGEAELFARRVCASVASRTGQHGPGHSSGEADTGEEKKHGEEAAVGGRTRFPHLAAGGAASASPLRDMRHKKQRQHGRRRRQVSDSAEGDIWAGEEAYETGEDTWRDHVDEDWEDWRRWVRISPQKLCAFAIIALVYRVEAALRPVKDAAERIEISNDQHIQLLLRKYERKAEAVRQSIATVPAARVLALVLRKFQQDSDIVAAGIMLVRQSLAPYPDQRVVQIPRLRALQVDRRVSEAARFHGRDDRVRAEAGALMIAF